ncbi:hypothetical protein APS56_11750 [Pseudalgibacter alginicilyticus]|uniref:Secretion system C-terminal sorting domain-containing protein n=1 Tax=Pseudalgibacter alginicilyticus TaxID=1736674 RepID=A0A0P0CSF6_9FLAO|nr:T9SS type A sorting domain-containing protein [Pseudalgibacter alginicilyticus]ALJ05757.1 hypothetical protein APS56_11750 [Pseudalgibacter alginicilyticus]
MKTNILKIIFTLIGFNTTITYTQVALKKTTLKQQIEKSNLVVEGKVVSKKSFWSENRIYTVNTIEVYKVFKGSSISNNIEIITLGGVVGLQALKVSSSLKLNKGDVGVFTLQNTNTPENTNKSTKLQYKSYGAIQGFYKYSLNDDFAINPFNVKKGISDNFYNEIMSHTKTKYEEIASFNVKALQFKTNQSKTLLAPSAIVFSPTTVTAGTKSTITITIPQGNTGTNFGSTKGKVAFSNANDGGISFYEALDSQVLSWTSTSITVEVPTEAGTGTIKVTNSDGSSQTSDTNLIVSYSEANVIYDADDMSEFGGANGPLEPIAYQVQHVDENGNGGYTFQMHTEFNANTAAKEAFERALNTWRCTSKINWIIGAPTSVDEAVFESRPVQSPATAQQSVNVVRFDNGNELEEDVLGVCYSWYSGCSNGDSFEWFVSEMDFVFDDATVWNFGPNPTLTTIYDFETVALHELGHGHQLEHTIDNQVDGDNMDDVMHYALGFFEDQRILLPENITAANNVQSRSTNTIVCNQSPMISYSNSCGLAVEENTINDGITIYPNPTKGHLFISNDGLDNLIKITVYDVSGRLILEQGISEASRYQTVHLNNMSKGIYFVNIYSDKTFITKKIVLE